ncbi:L-lactate dehydrogenase A [Tothia fuscella]|uniref:L-lactate dehydrogenase n=1 Tax=Tothia fuscella TaxID=1048955 RepID=A0A9P4TT30_9PEZI|nr:L-lactate dehydrogenase A [Tothia fuscella]
MPTNKLTSRIAIVGVGDVGAAAVFALILSSVCGQILLVDTKEAFRDGQVLDLSDATHRGNSSTHVRAGTYQEAGQCDIVVITAGAKQKPGESRLQLIGRNIGILGSVISGMKPFKQDTILLLVANPVDVLTTFAQEISGLPKAQVIGSGTFLDSIRLRGHLAEKAEVAASSIDAYVLGEHGDSQFVAWSIATIGGVPIDKALPAGTFDRRELAESVKSTAQKIIEAKGATSYGIGSVVASICSSILFDKHNVRPISHWQQDHDCCLSLPVVLGRKGVVRNLPLPLDDEETKLLHESAKDLREVIDGARKNSEY